MRIRFLIPYLKLAYSILVRHTMNHNLDQNHHHTEVL